MYARTFIHTDIFKKKYIKETFVLNSFNVNKICNKLCMAKGFINTKRKEAEKKLRFQFKFKDVLNDTSVFRKNGY